MPLLDCPHSPACPTSATRWVCHQRTNLEDGVKRGFIQREMAERLLRKYKVPMTPASKVYRGSASPAPTTARLWSED